MLLFPHLRLGHAAVPFGSAEGGSATSAWPSASRFRAVLPSSEGSIDPSFPFISVPIPETERTFSSRSVTSSKSIAIFRLLLRWVILLTMALGTTAPKTVKFPQQSTAVGSRHLWIDVRQGELFAGIDGATSSDCQLDGTAKSLGIGWWWVAR